MNPQNSGSNENRTRNNPNITRSWEQFLRDTRVDIQSQVLGSETVLQKGQEFYLDKSPEKPENTRELPQRNSIEDTTQIETLRRQEAVTKKQIEEIKSEITKLIKETSELTGSIKSLGAKVATESAPSDPGKYHVGFFEWVLTTVRRARDDMENANIWMAEFNKKTNTYWQSVKTSGANNYHLSKERALATQTN